MRRKPLPTLQQLWPERQRRALAQRDRELARWFHRAAASPAIVLVLLAASRLGDGLFWYALMLALPWIDGPAGFVHALQMVAVGGIDLTIYRALKRHTARLRPYKSCPGIRAFCRTLDEHSFPSGHTMHAVAFSLLLAHWYPGVGSALWSITLLIGLSRVVLGVHYPSDVLAGAAVGALVAKFALVLF